MTGAAELLAAKVIRRFTGTGLTLATSESLTGGLIGAALTSVAGASKVYLGGVVAYATDLKTRLSGVEPRILHAHGAVSEETVRAMAEGVRRATGADWAVAASGVAGPSEQEGQPPGTVWIGIAGPRRAQARLFDLPGDRGQIRARAVVAALELLLAESDPA